VRELQVRFVHCTISDEPSFSTIERTLPGEPLGETPPDVIGAIFGWVPIGRPPTARAPNPE